MHYNENVFRFTSDVRGGSGLPFPFDSPSEYGQWLYSSCGLLLAMPSIDGHKMQYPPVFPSRSLFVSFFFLSPCAIPLISCKTRDDILSSQKKNKKKKKKVTYNEKLLIGFAVPLRSDVWRMRVHLFLLFQPVLRLIVSVFNPGLFVLHLPAVPLP